MCPNEWTDAAIFLALLGDASSLAHLVAEVVQLGATDATMTNDLELGDLGAVKREGTLNTDTEKTSVIPANGVFMAIGHTPATAFLNGLVDVDSAGYITVDGASTRTSEPGVFAAGDCVEDRKSTRLNSSH